MTGDCFQVFLEHISHEMKEETVKIVLDNAPSHCRHQVQWPSQMTTSSFPASSPELHPAEQLFREVRQLLANTIFENLASLPAAPITVLHRFWDQPSLLMSLTGSPWWLQALQSP
jgi:hypothetical protein